MKPRPLSPHLSVYRFRYTLTTSILNRATGLVLSLALLPLIAWLMAIAGGPETYARWQPALHSIGVRVLAVLAATALWYHAVAGIRHLVWDTGHALERIQAQRSAWIVAIVTLVLALLSAWLLLSGAGEAA